VLTILEGSTFCICDELGDLNGSTMGLFAEDTRFLSRCVLTVNGETPHLLSSGKAEYYSAGFFLRNPVAGGLEADELSIARERFVGDGMQDHVMVTNHGSRPVELVLALELESDFADIFAVKSYDFALGDPEHAPPLPAPVAPTLNAGASQFLFSAAGEGFEGHTQVLFSQPGDIEGSTISFPIALEPRGRWELRMDVIASADGIELQPHRAARQFGNERARVRDSLAAWQLSVPQLQASWDDLTHTFRQSVHDIAALRMREYRGSLPAAGMPWFMTVFGRDTIITCLQTLLFGPELARTALRVLGDLQASEDDPNLDAEPGKIVHEVRRGKAAHAWFARYYGTVDATPLYLILLSEVWRWTDDVLLLRELKRSALAALEWIDVYGDRDGDGFVEYDRRSARGLENQSWKDSGNSQLFRDGTPARSPIAPCEVQGYVYDAKRRLAEIAREAWRDRVLADRLEADAAVLRERFDEAFWCDERGHYALALDRDKAQVDSLCSNIGHLLWSGIVKPHRVDQVADCLMGEELWSGWGVRTMGAGDAGYNPLTYHNGTVWPHDNSLIAWGLARHARWPEAHRIARRMFDASAHFAHQLPEVFAGFARAETPFPIAYPTASRPQAWAAGTPVLLLQLLLGLVPDRRRHVLETHAPLELPSWLGSLRLSGVRAFDRSWEVRVDDGRVRVNEG
jgi:glycogen debranching enzyme